MVEQLAGGFECFAVDLPGSARRPALGPPTMPRPGGYAGASCASRGTSASTSPASRWAAGSPCSWHWTAPRRRRPRLPGRVRRGVGAAVPARVGRQHALACTADGADGHRHRPYPAVRKAVLPQGLAHGDRMRPGRLVATTFERFSNAPGFSAAARHALPGAARRRRRPAVPGHRRLGRARTGCWCTGRSRRARASGCRTRDTCTLTDCGHLPGWDDAALTAQRREVRRSPRTLRRSRRPRGPAAAPASPRR